MNQIIECVPNFSEGRNKNVIDQIAAEIRTIDGVSLLALDMGKDSNRTMVTFVGPPDEVVDAAFKAIQKASELIDMSQHLGAHPRMGATDVCPLIPVQGISSEELVTYAKKLGRQVGKELNIPVYFYGEAATKKSRVHVAQIRDGEYEALPEKMKDPGFKPDAGPAAFNAFSGATAIGVRGFLLAYNVNLNTQEEKLAKEIAKNIRTSGRVLKDKNQKVIRDKNGKPKRMRGKLDYCKANGWYIDQYSCAQVAMNLPNYEVTGLHTVYDAICHEADKMGLWVTGSELVGVAPKQALLDAGIHYLKKENENTNVPEETIINTAIKFLGLEDITPFKPDEKIIEYAIKKQRKLLVNLGVEGFVKELASESSIASGGSVSALSGALSAGLLAKVAQLTIGEADYLQYDDLMRKILVQSQNLNRMYLELLDKDADAINSLMEAVEMPKASEEEEEERETSIQQAAQYATEIPFNVLNLAVALVDLAEGCVEMGNADALQEVAVSVIQAEAAAEGAWMSVMMNLTFIENETMAESVKAKSDEILEEIKEKKENILQLVFEKLEE